MLDKKAGPTAFHGFLVGVELETGKITIDEVAELLANSILGVDHCGDVSVDHLGEVESLDEDGTLEVVTATPDAEEPTK